MSAQELEQVRAHLEVCAVCAREFRFEEQVIEDLRSKLRRVSTPTGLVASVLAGLPPSPPASGS